MLAQLPCQERSRTDTRDAPGAAFKYAKRRSQGNHGYGPTIARAPIWLTQHSRTERETNFLLAQSPCQERSRTDTRDAQGLGTHFAFAAGQHRRSRTDTRDKFSAGPDSPLLRSIFFVNRSFTIASSKPMRSLRKVLTEKDNASDN